MRYHFNSETGKSGICKAQKRDCPLVHGDTPQEACEKYELSQKDMLFSHSLAKKKGFVNHLEKLHSTPLKHLNSEDLSDALKYDANLSQMNIKTIRLAIDLANDLHTGQFRGPRDGNDQTPYIEHPLRNSLRLLRLGVKDQDIVVASLLHDTVEDGAQNFINRTSSEKIEENEARDKLRAHINNIFGSRVLNTVNAVTNEYVPKSKLGSLSIEERHETYRNHVEENISKSPEAFMVKVSDFFDNATSLHHTDMPGKEKGTYRRAIKYTPVVNIFRKHMKNIDLPVSSENLQVISGQLDRTEVRLRNIVEKYNDKFANYSVSKEIKDGF